MFDGYFKLFLQAISLHITVKPLLSGQARAPSGPSQVSA